MVNFATKKNKQIFNAHMSTLDTVILPDQTLKKWGLSNFALPNAKRIFEIL